MSTEPDHYSTAKPYDTVTIKPLSSYAKPSSPFGKILKKPIAKLSDVAFKPSSDTPKDMMLKEWVAIKTDIDDPWVSASKHLRAIQESRDPSTPNPYDRTVDLNGIVQAVPPEAITQAVAQAIAQAAPAPKSPSLKSIVNSDVDLEEAGWTYLRIMEAIVSENWRARDIDETIKEGDLLHYLSDPAANTYRVERIQGWKDVVMTQQEIDTHNYTIYTLDGGGKKKVSHGKTTADFRDMYDVPKGIQLQLPTDEREARRFFGCDVIVAELFEKGKVVKAYYPVLPTLRDKRFRVTFSQVFANFARRHFRNSISKLIPGRGNGIRLKRGVSPQYILKLALNKEDFGVKDVLNDIKRQMDAATTDKARNRLGALYATYQQMPEDIIDALLIKNDYRPKGAPSTSAPVPFITRMNERELIPADFKYEKAIGIEIETLCPMHRDKAAKCVPSFVRTAEDRSIKDGTGHDTYGPEGNGKGQFGAEFRILIKRAEMETRILLTIAALNAMGGKGVVVNKTCGMHIHFDMRTKTLSEVVVLAEKLTKWLIVLSELVPEARRKNKHCQLENPEKPHWAGVSTDAYGKHKTLEVRTHSATTDHIKIIQWIRLLETLMEMTFTPIPKTSTLDGLKMLPLSEADRTYWLKRHRQLNKGLYREKEAPKLDLGFLAIQNEDE